VGKHPIILTDEIVPPPALVRVGLDGLPASIRAQGERASRRFIEFFTANCEMTMSENVMTENAIAKNALYYPYIHIGKSEQDGVNWLKGTLLLFSQVQRMLPEGPIPGGDWPGISEFSTDLKGRRPLLARANLFSSQVNDAQRWLADKLLKDAKDPDFRVKFGFVSARQTLRPDDFGFQIHGGKIVRELQEVLTNYRHRLATGCGRVVDTLTQIPATSAMARASQI
jgi:hypothetical protein